MGIGIVAWYDGTGDVIMFMCEFQNPVVYTLEQVQGWAMLSIQPRCHDLDGDAEDLDQNSNDYPSDITS